MKINEKDIKISHIGNEASKVGVMFGAYFAAKALSGIVGKVTEKTISGLGANPNVPFIKAVKPIALIISGTTISYAVKDKYAKSVGTGVAFAGVEEGYRLIVGIKEDFLPREEVAGLGSDLVPTPTLNLPDIDEDEYSDAPHALEDRYEDEEVDLDGDDDEYDEYEELEL